MRFILPIAVAASLAGCATPYSEAPPATNFPTVSQQKAQSASHWQRIADDVATRLKPAIGNRAVFATPPGQNESEFSRAFHKHLVAALVNSGAQVMTRSGQGILNLVADSQLVAFSPERHQNRRFISATAIGAGLWGMYGLDLYPQTYSILGSLALTGMIDWNQWFNSQFASGPTPRHELIVSLRLSDDMQVLGAQTAVYYISDTDRSLYSPPPPPAKAYPAVPVQGGL